MEKLLTLQQVCDLLQVKPSLIYKWVHYGFVPYIKLGTRLRFRESAIAIWVKKREKRGRLTQKYTII